ncbi:MAG TPA: carbamoyl phosphate synthase large subunit, partial [Clostridiales bacterium]|nr:carbamoyl phosphate synthase large subunit [Clostridiales bacterium]
PDRPILIDRFLSHAIECEADAIADGQDAFVPAVMEHIEWAGIHSGDSACVIPPISIPPRHLASIIEYTEKIARAMHVVGLMNMQYAICDDKVYVLEANPRASRTVPLVSKVCSVSMARIATQIIMAAASGQPYSVRSLARKEIPYFGVKEAVFPFNMFPEVDPLLGPEMRSTGEVLGMADSFGLAYFKAQEATQSALPVAGTVLISVNDADKPQVVEVAAEFARIGFRIMATAGTHRFLADQGIESVEVKKLYEGRPNIVDSITNKEINLVINTAAGKRSQYDDSYIRKTAIKYKIPYITTMTAALASAKGIAAYKENGSHGSRLKSLQEYHAMIKKDG